MAGWTKVPKPTDRFASSTITHAAGKFMGILGLTYAGTAVVSGSTDTWTKVAKPSIDNWSKVSKPTD